MGKASGLIHALALLAACTPPSYPAGGGTWRLFSCDCDRGPPAGTLTTLSGSTAARQIQQGSPGLQAAAGIGYFNTGSK